MFGNSLLCQRGANLRACNLKIDVTDNIHKRNGAFCVPPISNSKKINLITVFCFICTCVLWGYSHIQEWHKLCRDRQESNTVVLTGLKLETCKALIY